MTRIDLLSVERLRSSRVLVGVLASRELRSVLLVPAIVLVAVITMMIYEHGKLADLDTTMHIEQRQYRALLTEEARANLQSHNYEKLQVIAKRLFAIRRSAAREAKEIKTIGNAVHDSSLMLTSISDQGTPGTHSGWTLRGTAFDKNDAITCVSYLAASLQTFLAIPFVESAIPSAQRSHAGPTCDYTIQLETRQAQ